MRRLIPLVATLLMTGCGGPSDQQAHAPAAQTPPVAAAPPPASHDTSGTPPIPLLDAAGPPDIVRAVYMFAADHPEILGKVPCFCGCQGRGHRNNDDCFVAGRDRAGRVTAWEPHGAT